MKFKDHIAKGNKVRIYATDGSEPYIIHGAYLTEDNEWEQLSWTKEGIFMNDGPVTQGYNLMPEPVYEWQWHIYDEECDCFELTGGFFTEEDIHRRGMFNYEKFEPSKRERI